MRERPGSRVRIVLRRRETAERVFEIAVRLLRGETFQFPSREGVPLIADARTIRLAANGRPLLAGDTFDMAYVVARAERPVALRLPRRSTR